MRVGGIFLRPPILVDDLEDVTTQNINALVWGKTFALGSVINSVIAALLAYFLFLLAYERIRPVALRWLRRQVRQRRSLLTRAAPPA